MPRLSQHPAAKKSRARRKRYRAKIIELLGGKCDKCGTISKKLEPHHKAVRDWKSHERWALSRLLKYLREIAAGVPLGLLCRGCNARLNSGNGDDSDNF